MTAYLLRWIWLFVVVNKRGTGLRSQAAIDLSLTANDGADHGCGASDGFGCGQGADRCRSSDPLGYTAQPLLTLWRKSRGEDLRSLLRLIRKHEVGAIVVGNPLHLSGDVTAWAAKVQAFAAELGTRSGLPIAALDERLSSVAAHEILDEAGHRPARS